MSEREDIPEDAETVTPTIEIPETPSLREIKKDQPLPERVETSPPSHRASGKEQREGAGKSVQLEQASAKTGIFQSKEKLVASPEVRRSSTKRTRSFHQSFGNGGAQEAYHASSSTQRAVHPLTTECAKLSISSKQPAESAIILHCNDEDMPLPVTILVEDEVIDDPDDDPDCAEILEVVQDDPEGVEPLLVEVMDDILGRLAVLEALQLRPELGRACSNAIHRPGFRRNRPNSEAEFSPTKFMADANGDLHWHGFDTKSRKWTRLPPLNFAPKILPSLDSDLFKDYLMAGDGGLLCVNVGKATGRDEKLVICNPLTRMGKVLPPLIYARHPVLMHLKVDHESGQYQVIVAGSFKIGTKELSLKTEVYDSKTGVWECPDGSDLPCPPFGLNEYQNGAYIKDGKRELLMCVAIVDRQGRGVLMYDLRKKRWARGSYVKQLHIPLIRSEAPNSFHLATTQIVECGGSVYVFSEQEFGRDVYFVIHKLNLEDSGDFKWDEVMKRKKTESEFHVKFTCVTLNDYALCLVNTEDYAMEIVDLRNPMDVTTVVDAPTAEGRGLCTANPPALPFKISFKSRPCPGRCDLEREEYCTKCRRTCSKSVASGSDMNVALDVTHEQAIVAPVEETDIITADDNLENALKIDSQFFEEVFDFLDEVDAVV